MTTNTTILASKMPLLSPSALLQAHLSQNPQTRPSDRTPLQTRPIHLNTSSLTHCNGSSVVRIGEATVVCGIRAEILPVTEIAHFRPRNAIQAASSQETDTTDTDESYEAVRLNNLVVPNLELSTGVHPLYPAQTAPSLTAQSLSQRLLRSLHTTRLVRTSDLEIHSTSSTEQTLDPDDPLYTPTPPHTLKAYWTLYIDCICLSYGGAGATFDTAWFAIYAALNDTLLPQTHWDQDEKLILCSADPAKAQKLCLRGFPVPLSFGVFTSDPRLRMNASKDSQPDQQVNGTHSTNPGANIKTNPGATLISAAQSTLLVDLDAFEDDTCSEKGCIMIDASTGKIASLEKAGGTGALDVQRIKQLVGLVGQRAEEWKNLLEVETNK